MSNLPLESEFESYASVIRENLKEAEREAVASEFMQAITAGRSAVDGIKRLNALIDEIKDVEKRGELMRIIGELKQELGETKIELANEREEKNNFKVRIKALEAEVERLRNYLKTEGRI